jgi:hypothetical protein
MYHLSLFRKLYCPRWEVQKFGVFASNDDEKSSAKDYPEWSEEKGSRAILHDSSSMILILIFEFIKSHKFAHN